MKTYQDMITVVELSPLETSIFCVLISALLVIFSWSVKTDVAGNVVGFDWSWAYILRRFQKKGDKKE